MISFDTTCLSDFNAATSREWLETNGIGGYASGTVSGSHSRRYHGLLIAAVKPPVERAVLLSKFEETIVISGQRYELSSNRYPGTVYPNGFESITGFRLDPFPVWTYSVGGVEVEKRVFMVNGENSTVVRWSANIRRGDERKVELELRPLLAFRDHHQLRNGSRDLDAGFERGDTFIAFAPRADMPTLYLSNNAIAVSKTGNWYRNFEYEIERERGFEFTEDLFQPCILSFDLAQPASVIASTSLRSVKDADAIEEAERARRSGLVAFAGTALSKQLAHSADQFVVDRGDGKTVMAGYHWFSDWGRDTMIALNGLTIATGRTDITKRVLKQFASHLSKGMLPNRFPDADDIPEYNTVDATLWFFEAIRAYLEKTGDLAFVRDVLYDRLVETIGWHERGTRYNIHVDTDGLLSAGEPGVQLTWMDAKIGDWVVTPRIGKAVEIQALWYNALCIMSDLADKFGEADNRDHYLNLAKVARESFNGQFWNDEDKCLFDVINESEKDASIRPNQIFAVSLPYSMLDSERARMVVDKVEDELLTPLGLRSLSARDSRFVPTYVGSPFDRDASYHQGTVWSWLIGPFVDAYKKVHGTNGATTRRVREICATFESHLSEGMLGQISEIFDGESPRTPRGCAAQAWSVAELLRVTLATP